MATTSTNAQGGGFSTGARRAVGADYVYNDGMSEDDFIKRNAFGAESGYGFTNFLNPVGGIINGLKGRRAYVRARADYWRRQDEADAANRAATLKDKAMSLYAMQSHEDALRGGALGNLDAAYNDGTRETSRENEYSAGLDNATAGLAEQNRFANKSNAIAQARAGRLGGSVDLEQQGRLSSALQGGVYDAANTGLRRLYDANTADTNQYYAQRRALLSGNPERAAQYSAMAQGIGNDVERSNRLDDYLSARAQLRGDAADNNSRLIGGVANAGAGYVQSRYGYGGRF